MKLLILPLCALCAAVANAQKSPTLEAAALDFGTWANMHGKTYASSDEKLREKQRLKRTARK